MVCVCEREREFYIVQADMMSLSNDGASCYPGGLEDQAGNSPVDQMIFSQTLSKYSNHFFQLS